MSYFAVSFLLRIDGRVVSWDHHTRFTVSLTLELKMCLLNPSIYHDLFDLWGSSSRFVFQLFQCQTMRKLLAKPGKKKHIPGANFWSFNFTTLNVFVFFFEISNFSKLKVSAPAFLFFHKKSTAQNWPRVGPKQMAAWEKYFNIASSRGFRDYGGISSCFPKDPWDWYIYLYIWLILMVNVVNIPYMDPMGPVLLPIGFESLE